MLPQFIIEQHPDALAEGRAAFPLVRATAGAAGFDICAAEGAEMFTGDVRVIRTGLRFSIPPGYEAQIRPRSGLAAKHGITVLNAPGTIDSDYEGEVGVILQRVRFNHLLLPSHYIQPGDRIAQVVFAQVADIDIDGLVQDAKSPRGSGGFGSTGR
jgi:dUTP pyrophosphatase